METEKVSTCIFIFLLSFLRIPNLQLTGIAIYATGDNLRLRFGQFLSLGNDYLDGANHVEGSLGQMVHFAVQDHLESLQK